MSRFTNDIDTIGEMLNTTLIQIISGAITILGTIVLMLYTSPVLGAITIIATPLLTYLSKVIMQKGRKAYSRQQRGLGMLLSLIHIYAIKRNALLENVTLDENGKIDFTDKSAVSYTHLGNGPAGAGGYLRYGN